MAGPHCRYCGPESCTITNRIEPHTRYSRAWSAHLDDKIRQVQSIPGMARASPDFLHQK